MSAVEDKPEQVHAEEHPDSDSDSDHEGHDHEGHGHDHDHDHDHKDGDESKQSRAEKKARKALAKLGLKPLPEVTRVIMRKSKTVVFVIAKPDVFKSPVSDIYIVFGEAKADDSSFQQQLEAASQFKNSAPAAAAEAPAAAATTEVDESNVDETGLDPKHIELVSSQTGCTRAKAVAALKAANNDVVNAIMSLTS
eukprot:m.18453 g.18453  ORF g.18453 m.18453 type:complete len:195 (+) comp30154_c0_seq1:187-771(+)